jgi:hypothetical protein
MRPAWPSVALMCCLGWFGPADWLDSERDRHLAHTLENQCFRHRFTGPERRFEIDKYHMVPPGLSVASPPAGTGRPSVSSGMLAIPFSAPKA